jgi:hypothetical protein
MRKMHIGIALLLLTAVTVNASSPPISKYVTGLVVDEKGNAIPYATIKLKNTKAGSVSNTSGTFIMHANAGEKYVISAAGFIDKEIIISDDNSITITLNHEAVDFAVIAAAKALLQKLFQLMNR